MKSRALLITLVLSLGSSFTVGIMAGSRSLRRQKALFFQTTLTSAAGGLAQLFFDIGRGINEKDSVLIKVQKNETKTCKFPLPFDKIYSLRFDPINNEANVSITASMVIDSNGTILYRFRPTDFTPGQHIKTVEKLDDGVAIVCLEGGVDPFLNLTVPPNLSATFILKDWVRIVVSTTCVVFLALAAICWVALSIKETTLGTIATTFNSRPVLTLGSLAALAVFLQFHPLYFPVGTAANDSGTILNFTSYNSGKTKLESPSYSPLAPGNLFFSIPQVMGNSRWAKATGVIVAWWAYVFGTALVSWLMTRSLTTAALVGGCVLFATAWKTGVLPLSAPALVMTPWILLAWGWLATTPKSYKVFLLSGAAILLGNLEMIAIESSLRTAMLAVATTVGGLLFIGFQPQPRRMRVFRAAIGLLFFGLCGALVALTVWRAMLTPGDGSEEVARSGLQAVPATIGLSLFEGFFLLQNPGSFPLPSLNLVVLAGLAWAFARSEENYSKAGFIALTIVVLTVAVFAGGMLPDSVFVAWIRRSNAAQFQHAGWYSLTALLPLLASFGFADLRQTVESSDRAIYLAKATLIFFTPFVMYFGTVQLHAAYTFKSSYLICIIAGWIVAHVALTRLRLTTERTASQVLVAFTVLLVWWHHLPYVHLFLREAISSQ